MIPWGGWNLACQIPKNRAPYQTLLRHPWTIYLTCDLLWPTCELLLPGVCFVSRPWLPPCSDQSGGQSRRTRLPPFTHYKNYCSLLLWYHYWYSLSALLPVWVQHPLISRLHVFNQSILYLLQILRLYLIPWYMWKVHTSFWTLDASGIWCLWY